MFYTFKNELWLKLFSKIANKYFVSDASMFWLVLNGGNYIIIHIK